MITTREAVALRLKELCKAKGMAPYRLSIESAVPPSTTKSILNGQSRNPGVVTLKKLCDGLGITLVEFLDSDLFRQTENQ